MTIGSILCASARMNRCDHLVQRPRRSGIGADFIHSSSRFILRPFCSITVDVSNAAFCGGGQGDDENASRKSSDSRNNRNVTSALSTPVFCGGGQGDDENASRKSSDSRNNRNVTSALSTPVFCGGGQGDDENASRKSSDSHESLKDDKSNEVKDADDHPIAILTSALTNASNKPAEPTSKEAHHRMMDSREFH